MYLAPWSHREIFVQATDGALLWQANQSNDWTCLQIFKKVNSFAAEIFPASKMKREDQDFRFERIHIFWKFVNTSSRCLKSPYGTMEQGTCTVLNSALPSPGQDKFVSPAIRSGFECVHRWSQQHDLSARMDSFLRFKALYCALWRWIWLGI